MKVQQTLNPFFDFRVIVRRNHEIARYQGMKRWTKESRLEKALVFIPLHNP